MSAKLPKYDWPIKWPDEKKLTRNWLGLVLFGVALLTIFPAIYVIFRFYGALVTGSSEDVRNVGIIFLAVLGAPFVIWRAIVAQGNLDRSRDRDYADLFTKAVEQLGATREAREWDEETKRDIYRHEPNIEVRLGAIYALERISQDSERDHIAVMETLSAYVRENAPVNSLEPCEPPFSKATVRNDIQAALTVIGSRLSERISFEWKNEFRLNFSSTDLAGADFQELNFSAALFVGCRLEAANFRSAVLLGARFDRSLMNFADVFDAELRGTSFDYCIFSPTDPYGLTMSNIHSISVVGADLSGIDYLGDVQECQKTFGSKDTVLNAEMDSDRREQAGTAMRLELYERRGDVEKIAEFQSKLDQSHFGYWFEHNSSDMALSWARSKFYDRYELSGWPYRR